MDEKEWRGRICNRVREIRQRLGLSQMDFANRADLSFHTVGKIERREVFPELETLIKLSEAHRVPLTDFFDAPARVSTRKGRAIRDIVGLLRSQDEKRLDAVSGLVRYVLTKL